MTTSLRGLGRDLRHAAGALLRSPGYTSIAVLTLALGVGATTAMFSAVQAVLLRGLPYDNARDVVVVRQINTRDGTLAEGVSAANLRDVATATRTLSAVAGAEGLHGLRLVEEGRALSLRTWLVSEGFFEAIGGHAQLGRTFLPEEFVQGGHFVVLLSHAAWQNRFGGDARIVGRRLVLDDIPHTVVGVLARDFKFPSAAEVWSPRPPQPGDDRFRARPGMDGIARIKTGTTIVQAQAELDRVAADLAERHPETNGNMGLRLIPLRQHLLGDVESALLLLLGAVGVVLAIAAANVAGLQLARSAARSREFAVRAALGASAHRILRLVTVESLLLAGVGGAMGIGVAYLGVSGIQALGPDNLPRIDDVRVDGAVLVFAMVTALGSALVAGIAPAWRASKTDPQAALSSGPRGTTRGAGSSALRDRLVVVEIALALVLMVGAGLLVRSLERLMGNDLGFDPKGRLAAQVWAYNEAHEAQLSFFDRSVEAIGRLPGVVAVGLTTDLPLADDNSILSRRVVVPFTIENRPAPREGEELLGALTVIDGEYARAMGVPVRVGRPFSEADGAQSPLVALVNEAFVRRHFPTESPLGRRITLRRNGETATEIVGVLGDVRRQGLESEPRPEIYLPLSQSSSNGLTFVIATAGDPAALVVPVQRAMWSVDARQATWATRTMTDLVDDWTRQRRFNAVLFVAFASVALTLAGIGVYGLMSFSVEQRVNELGVRRALGATTVDIMGLVLRRGLVLAVAGTGLGLLGALVLTSLLQSQLYGVGAFDVATFVMVSAFVIVTVLLSSFVPARRATSVDPMLALRAD